MRNDFKMMHIKTFLSLMIIPMFFLFAEDYDKEGLSIFKKKDKKEEAKKPEVEKKEERSKAEINKDKNDEKDNKGNSKKIKKSKRVPIQIEADESEYVGKDKRKVVFLGNVETDDGEMKMTCEKLTVFLNEKRKIIRIIAEENVDIRGDNMHATATRVVYEYVKDVMTFYGPPNPKLTQSGNNFEAPVIIYNKKNETVKTKGRIKGNFIPEEKAPDKKDDKKKDDKESEDKKDDKE